MFGRFARHQAVWERAVQCLGLLDCLLALARFSRECEVGCRPEMVTGQKQVRRGGVDVVGCGWLHALPSWLHYLISAWLDL